jgi:hypothetical protein
MNNSRYVKILCCPICGMPVVENEGDDDDVKPFACYNGAAHLKETFSENDCDICIAIKYN